MYITEIVTPSMVQTQEARETMFGPAWSATYPIVFKYSGLETRAKGQMLIRDNEKLPDSAFLPVFGFGIHFAPSILRHDAGEHS
jgi:hypothetical protein